MMHVYALVAAQHQAVSTSSLADIVGVEFIVTSDFTDFLAQVNSYRPQVVLLDTDSEHATRIIMESIKSSGVQHILGLRHNINGSDKLESQRFDCTTASAMDLPFDEIFTIDGGDVTELQHHLQRVLGHLHAADETAQAGTVHAFWGPQGSPGRTALSLAGATLLAAQGPALSVDADTLAPSMAQFLGLDIDQPGLIWASREANRGNLSPESLRQQAVSVPGGFDVLTGLNRSTRWIELDEPNMSQLWQVARQSYRHVIVDVGFFLEEPAPWQSDGFSYRSVAGYSAIQTADHLVTVTQIHPVAITRCVNQLADLRDQGLIPPQHTVILNRVKAGEKRYIRQAKDLLRSYVDRERIFVLREDPANFDRAVLRCQTVPTFNPQAEVSRTLQTALVAER